MVSRTSTHFRSGVAVSCWRTGIQFAFVVNQGCFIVAQGLGLPDTKDNNKTHTVFADTDLKDKNMPRGIRKKARQYVLDRFQEEDPESYFKYKMHTGLNQDQMELLQAISNQSVHQVKTHLNKGVDPNFTVVPGKVTPLHIAVKNFVPENPSSEKILRSLLFFGAETEASDMNGNTALHEACNCHSAGSVILLIEAGAELNSRNYQEETPLMTTCRYPKDPSLAIVDLLLSAGAVTSLTNPTGQTALHILSSAVSSEPSYEMVRHEIALLLMKNGLRADEEDKNGKTPLSYELLQMSHCSANATLALDLLKKGSDMTAVTGTAISLVQGGALHTSSHYKELENLISMLPGHSHSLGLLQSFFGDISEFVSPAVWKRINRLLNQVNHRSTLIVGMQYSLGLSNPQVLPLSHLAKFSIRSALKGAVLHTADHLRVPEKIKTFILCEE